MADPMTREKFSELIGDMECGAGPDGGDILNACDELIAQERAEVERLRAELAERKRLSTSPTRDDATGLETLCAFLHAAGEADPNVIKDVAWRTFGLIRVYREQRTEVEQWRATFGESALRDARDVLAERDDYKQRLDQAMQDEAAITHEWDQARTAIERMGWILDGGDDRG